MLFSGKYLLQIRSHLYQEEEYHSSEQERMRNEISDLTQELHQKEITIATVMKKAALLERQLKMELEIKEKMLSKQQVCEGQERLSRSPLFSAESPCLLTAGSVLFLLRFLSLAAQKCLVESHNTWVR